MTIKNNNNIFELPEIKLNKKTDRLNNKTNKLKYLKRALKK